MAISKDKKQAITKELKENLADASSVVFVNFHGLSVSHATELRKNLRENDTNYKVAKKTLIKRVLDDMKKEGEAPELEGEVAVSWGSDMVAPAKELYNFEKGADEKFKILGGILEDRYISRDEVLTLAKIPGREVLLSQLVNVMNAPIAGFASVLSNTVSGLPRVLNEVAKTK